MVHQQGQQQCGLQTLCNHEDVTLQAALLPVHCLLTHHLWASAWSLIQHNTSKTIEYVEPACNNAYTPLVAMK